MPKILQKEAKELRKKSQKVSKTDFGTSALTKIIKQMESALESQFDGVALAAPQIGINLRIFIVSWKIYAAMDGIDMEKLEKEDLKDTRQRYNNTVFINPEIIKTSKDQTWMEEGCLSVRPFYGEVLRANKCRVRAQDVNGKKFEVGGAAIMAQIFQHEIDHLDGVLFTDKARNIQEISNEEFTASNNS